MQLRRINERKPRMWNNPRPVPMTALRPGVVVWAEVPFVDDESQSKGRPVVVVDLREGEVEVLPITSSPARLRRPSGHVELAGWEEAGLTRPSAVRRHAVRVARPHATEILGELTQIDAEVVLGRSPMTAA